MAKKRGNGEGTIYQRPDGTWCSQITVYVDGRRKRPTLYGKTRREVDKQLTRAKANREDGLTFDAGNLKLGEYLDRWLTDSVRDTVRQRTYERYEQMVHVHIKPTLGHVKVKALNAAHVRGLYREKLDAGLAPRTVRYVHTTLNKALKDALADGLIPRNVASAVRPPKLTKKEIRPLSPKEASLFLEAARGERFEALYVVAITAGLREGELLGLKWEDTNLEAGTLAVRRTLSEARSGRFFEPPKNGKGRSIRLTARAIDVLKQHKASQNEERLRLGTLWHDGDLVFPSLTGTPMNAKNLTSRSFKPLVEQVGLPRTVRFHDLRHTCATLLLGKGVHPKIVQELLGHATIAITLDTYSHVLPNMQGEAVHAMENALI
jgi:integrase